MKQLTEAQYNALRDGARVEAADKHGDKVLHLTDGTYVKLFRVKRLITSAWLFPYWKRFESNAAGLEKLGVPTLRVIEVFELPHLKRTAVHYDPLPGRTMREVDLDERRAAQFGRFLNGLHEMGVYLRSLHLGNVILTPDDQLGLIDFADMQLLGKPLSKGRRRRNFYHLCRYEADRQQLEPYLESFVSEFDSSLQPGMRKMFGQPVSA